MFKKIQNISAFKFLLNAIIFIHHYVEVIKQTTAQHINDFPL
jgi:hypothetical protein